MKKLLLFACLLAVLASGCKKEKDQIVELSLTFDSESYEVNENEELDLSEHLKIVPATTDTVKWTTSDEKVLYVDAGGTIKGLFSGEATVTASVHGKSASCKVVVKEIPITQFSLPTNITAYKGIKTSMDVTVLPEGASAAHIEWKSAIDGVVPFFDGETGQWCILTDYIGDALMKASYGSLESQTCLVSVLDPTKTPVESYKLSWSTYPQNKLNFKSKVKIYAYDIAPEGANYADINFKVDNLELATLSAPLYDSKAKQYYCMLSSKSTSGEVVVTASVKSGQEKSISFNIAKTDIESISLMETDIATRPGSDAFMGQGYTLTPADAYVENISFSIKASNGLLVPNDVMKYEKAKNGSYYLVVGESASAGRYTVTAIADGVQSKPMYVNVVTKEWVLDNLIDELPIEKYNDGYKVTYFGTLGMREYITPWDLIKNYHSLDNSLQVALWMTFDGITNNADKAFYFCRDYAKGTQITHMFAFDYAFNPIEYPSPEKIKFGSFKCTLIAGPLNGKNITIPLYFEVYTSTYSFYRIRTNYNGFSTKSNLDYEDDCMCVGPHTVGSSLTQYQDAVELYFTYAGDAAGTASKIRTFKWWSTPVNGQGGNTYHPWSINMNVFPIDLKERNVQSKLPDNEGMQMHTTINFHTNSSGSCKYEKNPTKRY